MENTNNTMKWINLSTYGLRLAAVSSPDQSVMTFALAPLSSTNVDQKEIDKNINEIGGFLGWMRLEQSGNVIFINPAEDQKSINLPNFLNETYSLLKNNGVDDIGVTEVEQHTVFLSAPKSSENSKIDAPQSQADTLKKPTVNNKTATPTVSEEKALLQKRDLEIIEIIKSSSDLGNNINKDPVLEYHDKSQRIIPKDDVRSTIFENENNTPAGMFLRASSDGDLKLCVKTIANDLISGKSLTTDDIKNFAKIIYGENYSQRQWQDLINGMDNYITSTLQSDEVKIGLDLFKKSEVIINNSYYLADLNTNVNTNANLNLTVSTVINMLSNSLSKEETKVAFINPGNAAPLGRWHRGRKSNFQILETNPEKLASIKLFASELSVRGKDFINKTELNDNLDVIIANLDKNPNLSEPYEFDGQMFNHTEFKSAFELLNGRSDNGNAVFTFYADKNNGNYQEELQKFVEKLNLHYFVEGIAEVDSSIHAKNDAGANLMMFSISRKRQTALTTVDETCHEIKKINNLEHFLEWGVDTAQTSRTKLENMFSNFEKDSNGEDNREKNKLQSPYQSATGLQASLMVPSLLQEPTLNALSNLQREVGNVVDYVSSRIGKPKEFIVNKFTPEQIDLVGLEQLSRDFGKKGFHIADETGTGKGMSQALVIGAYLLSLKKVVWSTKAAANIRDQYRDLVDSGIHEYANPLILNDNETTKEEEISIDPITGEEVTKIVTAKKPYSYTSQETGESITTNGLSNNEETWDKFCTYEWIPFEIRSGSLLFFHPEKNEENVFEMDLENTPVEDINRIVSEKINEGWDFSGGDVGYVDANNDKDIDVQINTLSKLKSEFPNTGLIRESRRSRKILDVHIPPEYNMIITSYSQARNEIEKKISEEPNSFATLKLRLLFKFVDEDTVLCMDEVAEVTGDGNQSKNFKKLMEKADRVITASATHASNPKTLSFYHYLLPDDISEEELIDICKKHGDTASEIFTKLMVETGIMVRREHNMEKIEFSFYEDKENYKKNCDFMDALTPLLSELAFKAGDLKHNINKQERTAMRTASRAEAFLMAQEVDDMLGDLENEARNGGRDGAEQQLRDARSHIKKLGVQGLAGIGSPFYRIMKVVYASLKAETSAKRAIEHNLAGGRSIIVCDSVISAIMEEAYKKQIETGEIANRPPDIKDFLRREVGNLGSSSKKRLRQNNYNNEQLRENDVNTLQIIDGFLEKINDVPDLPVSSIDIMAQKIREAGLNPGEITGRKYECIGNEIRSRKYCPPAAMYDAFNNGEIDILLPNEAGLTGFSAQDAPWFKNHGQRKMIFNDPSASVRTIKQAIGRIMRLMSMTTAVVELINPGPEAHGTRNSVMKKKLSGMSAITTGNRETLFGEKEIVDFYTSSGNKITRQWCADYPEIAQAIGIEFENIDNLDSAVEKDGGIIGHMGLDKYSAHQILTKIDLLPTDQQRQIIKTLTFELKSLVDELDRTNRNPDKPSKLSGSVKIKEQTLIQGVPGVDPVYLSSGICEQTLEPLNSNDIDALVTSGLKEFDEQANKLLANQIRDYETAKIRQFMVDNNVASFDEVMDQYPTKKRLYMRKVAMADLIEKVTPGTQIEFYDQFRNEIVSAVVAKVTIPKNKFEKHQLLDPVDIRFEFASPGDVITTPTRFSNLLEQDPSGVWLNDFIRKDGSYRINEEGIKGDGASSNAILESYNNVDAKHRQYRVRFLTGHAPSILKLASTQKDPVSKKYALIWSSFTTDDGIAVQGGLVTSPRWKPDQCPIKMQKANKIMDALNSEEMSNDRIGIYPDEDCKISTLAFFKYRGQYSCKIPGQKHYLNRKIKNPEMDRFLAEQKALGNIYTTAQKQKTFRTDSQEDFDQFVNLIVDNSELRYHAKEYFREWSIEWDAQNNETIKMTSELDDQSNESVMVA